MFTSEDDTLQQPHEKFHHADEKYRVSHNRRFEKTPTVAIYIEQKFSNVRNRGHSLPTVYYTWRQRRRLISQLWLTDSIARHICDEPRTFICHLTSGLQKCFSVTVLLKIIYLECIRIGSLFIAHSDRLMFIVQRTM